MTITRLAPLRDVAVLQNRLNSIFNDFAQPSSGTEALSSGAFVPPVDIYEDAQKLSLRLEVPGLRPEEVDIHVENQTLTVRGERKFKNEEKEENFHRIERRYGSFTRTFSLPLTVDTEKVQANYEHGVLSIELPKKPEAKPKQIKVSINNVGAADKQVEGSAA